MVYPTSSITDQVLVFDRLAQAWDTLDSPYFSGAVWSPDGDWLAGQPIIYGNPTSNPLLLVRADGGEWRNLLEDEPGFKSPLGWMDENRIVFLQVLDNVEPSFHARVQVFDLKSGALVPLQEISYEEGLNGPVLSPDGSHLAFGIDRASPYEITLLDIASGSATTIEVSVQGGLGWSPDGRWLIITAALGFSCEIHLVSPDGLETHKVFTGDWGGACNNTWSPDGDYLLVSANAQNPTVPRLYVISIADGESWLVELPDVGVEFEWPRAYWVP
jgi:Tol biopolymer transport system component